MLFTAILMLTAAPQTPQAPQVPQASQASQAEYQRAGKILDQVAEPPAEKVGRLERELDTVAGRVTELEQRLRGKKEESQRLEQVRIETALALRRHFQGEELEARLQEQEQDFQQRQEVLKTEAKALERDLGHAQERHARILAELKVAQVEEAVNRPPAAASSGTPLSDKLWEEARPLAMDRARRIGGFHWRSVPRAWLAEKKKGGRPPRAEKAAR